MEHYRQFSSEDFMQDPFFRNWVWAGDNERNAFWREFLSRFPEKKHDILTARAMLNAMDRLQKKPSAEQAVSMWQHISDCVETEVPEVGTHEVQSKVFPLWRWIGAACVTLLCCALGWYWYTGKSAPIAVTYSEQVEQAGTVLTEKINRSNKVQVITLPDGSRVRLALGGRISYQPSFGGDKREVYLSGEGFFDVVKNEKQPFFVFADRLVTQVVGTSFTVVSGERNPARVIVKTGKVRVYTLESLGNPNAGGEPQTVLLTPNMQVTYHADRNVLLKSLVAAPQLISPPADYPDFSFENTSIVRVFETLEKSYGVSITYDTKTIENCDLTAPLGDEPLFRKLDIICQTIDATYEVWGTEIVVSGKGCNRITP